MDEILYGGGQSVPVRAGNQPDESQVISDMFFIAPGTILSNEFEIVATRPIRLEGAPEEEAYVLLTFKGKVNNENKLGAVTVVMAPEMLRALLQSGRQTYSTIPLEHR